MGDKLIGNGKNDEKKDKLNKWGVGEMITSWSVNCEINCLVKYIRTLYQVCIPIRVPRYLLNTYAQFLTLRAPTYLTGLNIT